MNAPGLMSKPATSLPFDMQPYADGEFDKMHGPGSMLVSASNVAALFNKIPQRLGKLSYAAHLTGKKALPDISEEALIRVGHALEPLAAKLLGEELGSPVTKYDAYAMHPFLKMFATPDGVVDLEDGQGIVELKVVTPSVYHKHWSVGPPIHVGLQHQAQYACTGAERGLIAVLNLGWCNFKMFETTPHRRTIERIELGVDSFMSTLERGDMPAPDDTEADFEAFRRLMSLGNEKETISLASSEADRRALQWIQAKLDEKAGSSTAAAHQRWFQQRMGTAEIAKISDTLTATWTTCARAKGAEKAYRQFKIKETREENDG